MRRDCVTQVIVRWSDGEEDNFATPFEAENYINYMLDELGEPIAAWLEDMSAEKSGTTESLRTRKAHSGLLTDFSGDFS